MQIVDPENIAWSSFAYPIHHAEHAKLDGKQRQAIQHYAEMVRRLLKRRDEYRLRVERIPITGLGIEMHPDVETQDELFDLTQSFFEHTYSTLGGLASVHGRIKVFGEDPPISSVEKFLGWWSNLPSFLNQEKALSLLCEARDFRTILAHPQQQVVFDWGTATLPGAESVVIVLHGEASSKGNVPSGAESVAGQLNPRSWWFQSPSMNDVLGALLTLTSMTFHLMPAKFLLQPEEETCTWEADGFGSAPGIALQKQVSELLARDAPKAQFLFAGSHFSDNSRA